MRSLVSGKEIQSADSFSPELKKTVCISGHREKNIPAYNDDSSYGQLTVAAVKLMLYRYIDMAIERGYENFISGLAMGIDLWAAEYIAQKKQNGSMIRLIGAMPFLRHADFFDKEYKSLLAYAENAADVLICVNPDPDIVYSAVNKTLYRDRNYFMVDRSSAVIAFLNDGSSFSGTSQTVNYAYRTGRKICRFGVEDVHPLIAKNGSDLRKIGKDIAFLDNVFDLPY